MSEVRSDRWMPCVSNNRRGTYVLLLRLGTVCFVVAIGLAALKYYCDRMEFASEAECCANLIHIAEGLVYSSKGGLVPPAYLSDDRGRRVHSWRTFALASWNENFARAYDFTESWQHFKNAALAGRYAHHYACPARLSGSTVSTSYVALTGGGTAFDSGRRVRWEDLPDDLIIVVEVTHSTIDWMEPRDLRVDQIAGGMNELNGMRIGSDHRDGFFVMFADTTRWFLRHDVPVDELRKFFTVESAREYDRDDVLGAYRVGWP